MLMAMQEEAARIRAATGHEGPQEQSSVASLPSLKSLKLSSQRSFDIIACSGVLNRKACTTGASAPIASHVLTFDDEESE